MTHDLVKGSLVIGFFSIMLAGILSLAGADSNFVCVIDGQQEVPPISSPGKGAGIFVIDTAVNTLSYHISFSGLTSPENGAHIHGPATSTTSAGVLHALPAGNPKTGVWNYSEGQEADILAGNMYVNIHTNANSGGEIRGQIVHMVAIIDGIQENLSSPGQGFGHFMIDTVANNLSYVIKYSGLTSTVNNAHIHGYATHTANASPVFQLSTTANPQAGTWNYLEADEAKILAGLTYVNIHTVTNPGGEIRGQITNMVAPMDGSREAPTPVTSVAAGVGMFAIDTLNNMLSYYITYSNISGSETGAHIHGYASTTASAGVLHTLIPAVPSPYHKGAWNYPDGNESQILNNETYTNIHSTTYSGGEIRGQIEPALTMPPLPIRDWELYR